MNNELIKSTEAFLKQKLAENPHFASHPADGEYRLQHSYRVANIGRLIAEAEGFDPTDTVVACLLHDIAYCREFQTREDWLNHGRASAGIARAFLAEHGLPEERILAICYGIAIHVDDQADFEAERTAFSETVGDADNIDRFDAYRIYETLQSSSFSEKSFAAKEEFVRDMLERLTKYRDMPLGTPTATGIWRARLDFYLDFYARLSEQLKNSTALL